MIGCLLGLILIAAAVVLAMVVGAFVVGVSAAMFLHMPFSTGWHDAWQRPGWLAIFVIFLLPLARRFNFIRGN